MGLPITSNSEIKIDTHFKITAGPGAGKTTFLINHIKNIFKNSKKISIYRKEGWKIFLFIYKLLN